MPAKTMVKPLPGPGGAKTRSPGGSPAKGDWGSAGANTDDRAEAPLDETSSALARLGAKSEGGCLRWRMERPGTEEPGPYPIDGLKGNWRLGPTSADGESALRELLPPAG